MKRTIQSIAFIAIMIGLASCEKKKEEKPQEDAAVVYAIDGEASTMQWTAYKTSDKVPVRGTFKSISIDQSGTSSEMAGALNDLTFEIPVKSIFSNDTLRDGKLVRFFFDIMENTSQLKGKFQVTDESKGTIALSMNGMSKDLPFDYSVSGDTIVVNATMMVDNWGAQAALESLNEACKELHTGADGVSKTWNEVGIQAKIISRKK